MVRYQTDLHVEASRHQLHKQVDTLMDALESATNGDDLRPQEVALIALEQAELILTHLRLLRAQSARLARHRGATWQEVADHAGITRQAAWEQWS